MPENEVSATPKSQRGRTRRPDVVRREYAGKWIAWSPDGLRIVAHGDSFEQCEQAAAAAGFPAVAIEQVPESRWRQTGARLL